MKAYSHLSAEERIRIDELRNRDGLGVRQIALRIGRDKATVSRELKRGLWFASNENDSYRPYRPKRLKTGPWTCRPFYSAMTAQRKAEQRAREPRKPRRMAYDPLLAWVMTALRKGWTPERIDSFRMGFPVSWHSQTMALRMSLSFHSQEVTSQGRWIRVKLAAADKSIATCALLWVCR